MVILDDFSTLRPGRRCRLLRIVPFGVNPLVQCVRGSAILEQANCEFSNSLYQTSTQNDTFSRAFIDCPLLGPAAGGALAAARAPMGVIFPPTREAAHVALERLFSESGIAWACERSFMASDAMATNLRGKGDSGMNPGIAGGLATLGAAGELGVPDVPVGRDCASLIDERGFCRRPLEAMTGW